MVPTAVTSCSSGSSKVDVDRVARHFGWRITCRIRGWLRHRLRRFIRRIARGIVQRLAGWVLCRRSRRVVQRLGRRVLWRIRSLGHRNISLNCRSMSPARGGIAVARRATAGARGLFHPAAVKIALVRRVLLDVGSLPLLGGILTLGMPRRIILGRFGVAVASPFVAAIGRRHGRHVLGHCDGSNKNFGIKAQGHNHDARASFRRIVPRIKPIRSLFIGGVE